MDAQILNLDEARSLLNSRHHTGLSLPTRLHMAGLGLTQAATLFWVECAIAQAYSLMWVTSLASYGNSNSMSSAMASRAF